MKIQFLTSLVAGYLLLTGSPAVLQIYSSAQNVVHFQCSFGRTYDPGGHVTEVTLSRWGTDYYWYGSLTSTYNQ